MGYKGPKYTWSNCREGEAYTKERLDRGVANQEWRECFQEAEISVEFVVNSDHTPLFLNWQGRRVGEGVYCSFRYEANWDREKECHEIIN